MEFWLLRGTAFMCTMSVPAERMRGRSDPTAADVEDVGVAVVFLQGREEVDADRIGILGFSQGARSPCEQLRRPTVSVPWWPKRPGSLPWMTGRQGLPWSSAGWPSTIG